ncbi:MAG: S-methyl-5'-thioadenosine phosphorylase [Heliobacteriaceae bacterium]|nr:S-methyl-5'-thioadenosine phosphorylase [Heliobacteriaceae bacterium]MDD4587020.1 S-methyl-5'-thioadenosine phosphorylase [Heliobacteriaceae bacterium]
MQAQLAIIGGTGVYDPAMLTGLREVVVKNRFGDVPLTLGCYGDKIVAFLARHGAGHAVPPHLVNYRANILALKQLGVRQIIATAAVGSLNQQMAPGNLVIIDQFLDFTKSRPVTFFDGGESGVIHTDLTFPYCPRLRQVLLAAARELGQQVHDGGVYVCTEGPRFETAAEVRLFQHLGGDLVGMTSVPEANLAREAEMCYASVAMVTNFAAGISPTLLTHKEVLAAMQANVANIRTLIRRVLELAAGDVECTCHQAIADFGGFNLLPGKEN